MTGELVGNYDIWSLTLQNTTKVFFFLERQRRRLKVIRIVTVIRRKKLSAGKKVIHEYLSKNNDKEKLKV